MENKEFDDMLESDDELPTDYDEIPDLPAYQNNSRFDSIDFPWIDNKKFVEQCLPNEVSSRSSSENLTHTNREREESADKKLIKKGILTKRDIFCIRCVSTVSSNTTLIWLINFFMLKDMQSNYSFLKSCLVDNGSNEDLPFGKERNCDFKTHNYVVVVKNCC